MKSSKTSSAKLKKINFTNLDKCYSVQDRISKKDVINYYAEMADYILPHIVNKPFSMIHFTEGIHGDNFYQKQCPTDAPDFLKTVAIESSTRGHIDWCLINDLASMIYMANRNVLEMHSWFSRLPNLRNADVAIIDLDPSGNTGFKEAVKVAQAFQVLLDELNIFAIPMTSGGSGIHIRIPIKRTPFPKIQAFLNQLCQVVAASYPDLATMERKIDKRGNKIYLDAAQNAYGKTIVAPYSLRVRAKFPVATPLLWKELKNKQLKAEQFNISNIHHRLLKIGDLFKDFYSKAQVLPKIDD